MTIEPKMLGATIALVLGRNPGQPLVSELARVLELQEEVLPWLVLRQGAFDGDAEVQSRLSALAAAGNRPSRQRPAGPIIAADTYARKRDVEAALGAMIADNIAGTDHADTLGAMLHAHNSTLPGRPGYDFRRRIAEFAPEQDARVEAETEPEISDHTESEPGAVESL